MRGRTNRTLKKRDAFIDALCDGRSVTAACIDAGLSRRGAYDWREADPEFRKAWDEAIEEGTDRLEDEAHRRARDGVQKPVYQGGKRVGEVREYSDTLTIFLLKARRPEKFKDRAQHELVGANGGPIQTENVNARDELLGRIDKLAARSEEGTRKPH